MSLILIKLLVILPTALLKVLGLILIAFGIYLLFGENVDGGLFIGLGVVILIIAVFGCMAAIHEKLVRLLIYVGAVVLLILTQLLFLSMAPQRIKDGITGSIYEVLERYWEAERNESGALAYYENRLHCCGVNSSEDYLIIHHAIPSSCCLDNKCVDQSSVYKVGCKAKFAEDIDDKLLFFQNVCWLFVIGEAVGAVFSCILYRSVKNQSRRNNAV